MNVKHVIGDLGEVEKDSVVTMRFNSHHYQARVVNLLDWKPPEQHRKKHSSAAKKTTKPKASKRQQKPLFWRVARPQRDKRTVHQRLTLLGGWSLERLKRIPEEL